jgi:hypothetical protein
VMRGATYLAYRRSMPVNMILASSGESTPPCGVPLPS